ncbi:MAG: polysaccharide deacetylase family protein [Verrucomicrobiae bacterium]
MNHRSWHLIPLIAGLLGIACQSARTQPSQQPQVIAVPQGDLAPLVPAPAMQAPAPESSAGPTRPSYVSCNVEGPYIALTFDDGPHPTLTPKLLDLLKEKGIKVTFFVLGECVEANPDVLKRAAAEGHEIGNHSWDHKSFTKAGGAGVASEVNQTNAVIETATGKKPVLVRPPGGATNPTITRRLNTEFGLKVVMWDVDPLDWRFRNSARVTSEILKNTKAGSIILSHDIHPTTIAAMPATIDGLLEKGFQFVTVSELIAMDRPKPSVKPSPAAKPQ